MFYNFYSYVVMLLCVKEPFHYEANKVHVSSPIQGEDGTHVLTCPQIP